LLLTRFLSISDLDLASLWIFHSYVNSLMRIEDNLPVKLISNVYLQLMLVKIPLFIFVFILSITMFTAIKCTASNCVLCMVVVFPFKFTLDSFD